MNVTGIHDVRIDDMEQNDDADDIDNNEHVNHGEHRPFSVKEHDVLARSFKRYGDVLTKGEPLSIDALKKILPRNFDDESWNGFLADVSKMTINDDDQSGVQNPSTSRSSSSPSSSKRVRSSAGSFSITDGEPSDHSTPSKRQRLDKKPKNIAKNGSAPACIKNRKAAEKKNASKRAAETDSPTIAKKKCVLPQSTPTIAPTIAPTITKNKRPLPKQPTKTDRVLRSQKNK